MAKINLKGVGTAHDDNVFEITHKCKRERRWEKEK